jgi:hypothetical protein
MNPVMDRLRAANPVVDDPTPPPVEPLLARLAPSPPRRRFKRPLVLAFAATVALLAVVLGSELRGQSVDVVAEARAALSGTGGIVHVRVHEEQFNPDGSLVQRSGTRSEIWSASDPLRIHTRQATRSGGVFDAAYVDGVVKTRDSADGTVRTQRLDPASRKAMEDIDSGVDLTQPGRDPLPVIRKLLAEGKLKHDGSTTIQTRKVERLVGSEPPADDISPGVEVEYLVDARSFAPIRLTTKATLKDGRPAGGSRLTFETYERLPLTAANEALLRIAG